MADTVAAPATPSTTLVNPFIWGVGRRKSAVARVRVRPGSGKFIINKRELDEYFKLIPDREAARAALTVTESAGRWDVFVNLNGGGTTGQAGAVKLGLARALVKAMPEAESTLRDQGLLTRDARKVERKKYGRRGARRSFQFSKR
ncbi:MAG: 30S ribosomal protein S9 [Planctomycetes bacterium]|nr:30S ribosomal protein S9 [Planctomycetota bacterium]